MQFIYDIMMSIHKLAKSKLGLGLCVHPGYLYPLVIYYSAVDAGVTIVNEVGVDPGIDHLLAMDCFRLADQKGGKIESFVSWCGGLPAADFSANPLRLVYI